MSPVDDHSPRRFQFQMSGMFLGMIVVGLILTVVRAPASLVVIAPACAMALAFGWSGDPLLRFGAALAGGVFLPTIPVAIVLAIRQQVSLISSIEAALLAFTFQAAVATLLVCAILHISGGATSLPESPTTWIFAIAWGCTISLFSFAGGLTWGTIGFWSSILLFSMAAGMATYIAYRGPRTHSVR